MAQLAALVRQDATLSATVNLSASPFHHAKVADRITVARTAAARSGTPFLLANQVGGNDELVFDGSSIAAVDDVVLAPAWAGGLLTVDLVIVLLTWTPHAVDASPSCTRTPALCPDRRTDRDGSEASWTRGSVCGCRSGASSHRARLVQGVLQPSRPALLWAGWSAPRPRRLLRTASDDARGRPRPGGAWQRWREPARAGETSS